MATTLHFSEPEQVAWAAGLFEGEGSISLSTNKKPPTGRPYIRLTVVSTDRDVLERFRAIVGHGRIRAHSRVSPKPHWKPTFRWDLAAEDEIQAVMNLIGPWLCERRLARWNEAWQRWEDWNQQPERRGRPRARTA